MSTASDTSRITAPLLSATDLSASYDSVEVLHAVSASFRSGEFVCIIGPNGSGKSTFLTRLSGLEVPSLKTTGGNCSLVGQPVSDFKPLERAHHITFLPQNESYAWNYTVLEAVRMGRYAQSRGILSYSAADDAAALKALEKAGIKHLEKRTVFELSGGELQSVLIARALAQDTPVMLLDEPFTYLDINKSDRLFRFLKELTEKDGKCIVMSLHDVNLAPLYADRIILFSEGCIIADGKPEEVFTAENLEKAYGTPFMQYQHPVYGVPQVCVKAD